MVRTNVKVWYPECTLGWTSRALQRVWALRQFYLSCLIHSLWMRTTSASAKWWLFEKCSEIRKGEWKNWEKIKNFKDRKIQHERHTQWLQWTLFTVLNISLFSAAGWRPNNSTNKSGPQAGCNTYFVHSLSTDGTSPKCQWRANMPPLLKHKILL